MNGANVFLDTNVLVYLYSDTDTHKKKCAFSAISQCDCSVSTQVLKEFCNICIKKLKKTIAEIDSVIDEIYAACDCANVDIETIHKALALHERYEYSYYDSLVIASALECGCEYLLTEDMQDGQVINGMTITNIFKETEEEI